MKQLKWLLPAIVFFSSVAAAQNRILTIDDIFSVDPAVRINFSGTPMRLQWAKQGNAFKQTQNAKLMRVNAITGEATSYFDSPRLASALVTAGIGARDAERLANSTALQFNKNETGIVIT
ncbi:MAG: hypothetical protein ABI539_04640, partial [Acidobacteriota bacterium]